MSHESPEIRPGSKITHPELGQGVVVGYEATGYVTVTSSIDYTATALVARCFIWVMKK